MSWIIRELKEQSQKVTAGRRTIAAALTKQGECLFKIQDLIDTLPTMDRVSIYRTIELFAALDIVHPVAVEHGHQLYELHEPNAHHHHKKCEQCDTVKCVTCPIESTSDHHTLFFTTPHCTSCA